MVEWLSTYNEVCGMAPVSMITTIFGGFCVAFAVVICWPKLVHDFGPAGGIMAAAIIIGTFWVMNHKLPGFGIHPEGIADAEGKPLQFGLIYQGFEGAAPWIDMGLAVGVGLWICGFIETKRNRLGAAIESCPRLFAVLLGGVIGGAIVGMIGLTGADLFGWEEAMQAVK
jgi:hypothetical protein